MQPELKNKHVTVVGLGLTGLSCVRFLQQQGARVTALDTRSDKTFSVDVPVHLGPYTSEHLNSADLIIISPGVDPSDTALQGAREAGIEMIGDVELFARFNTKPVIAITGSNGKSTVTTLAAMMLQQSGINAQVGGNIGKPVLELLTEDADVLVLELSSFQLETVSSLNAKVATILNLSDDHLDRHGTMAAYRDAKHRIYHGAEHCVVNRDDAMTWTGAQHRDWSFGLEPTTHGFGWNAEQQVITLHDIDMLSLHDCLLMGAHNALNIQAAAACAMLAGAEQQAVVEAAKSFGGLPHRFETVTVRNGVRWINDSKATNVGATVAALEGVRHAKTGKLVLIAGGIGKGADFTSLQEPLLSIVDELITLGEDGPQIAALMNASTQVDSLEDAVRKADEVTSEGDLVLLSPACASMDMFDNYQHRGDSFSDAVRELAA